MPFKSSAQQRFMFAKHPDIAKRWAKETPNIKKLPKRSKPMAKKKTPNFLKGLKKGALHKQLGISENKNIPVSKLQQLTHSTNPKTRKRANFALVSRTWKKRGGK